ncbi:MAG TPA: lytic murein transglycosylase B [Steroidobacteraceae bacterium]|nr:lytic murein transglycosylase B [Steroidobacteraceae bacterium]
MNDHLSIALATQLISLAPVASASAVDVRRPEVRAFIEETSREFGIARDHIESLIAQAETKQAILDAISRPAERVVPWYEYRERFLTEKRILQGADFWVQHAEALRRIPDPNVAASVVGILGVETSFGRITGRFRVIDALATLAFDYPPRSDFFRSELQQFLLLSREEAVDPKTALGSYAGAMGAPQFISSSYRNYAIDGDGNGKRDLWNSWDDVIGSVANYLSVYGWREGEPVVVTATLASDDLSRFNTAKLELNETVRSLRDKGVRFETSLPADAPALLIVAQGKDGPVYRVGFTNFYVLTRYNRSPMYAMAVHDLGQAVVNFMRDATR